MKKQLERLLLCCMAALGLLTWGAAPARAAAETWSGEVGFHSDTTLPEGVTLSGDTTLTVAPGSTLTVENGIRCNGYTLTFAGPGSVAVTGGKGGFGIEGSVAQRGGTLTVTGGSGDSDGYGDGGAGIDGSVTLSGGTLTVTGGRGVSGSFGAGFGGDGIDGSVTLTEGTLTVTGGNGGFGFDGGSGGRGVYGGIIQSGGTMTALGGSGGSGGDGGGGPGGCGIWGGDGSDVALRGGELTALGGDGGSSGYGGDGGDGIRSACVVSGGLLSADGGIGGGSAYGDGDPASGGSGIGGSVTLVGGAVKAGSFSQATASVTAAQGSTYRIGGAGSYTGPLSPETLSAAAGKWLSTGYRSGSCGTGSVRYELIDSGGTGAASPARTLRFSGEGAMADYDEAHPAAWRLEGLAPSVTRAVIGSGVTNITPGAFSGCVGLEAVSVAAGNPDYRSEEGVLYRVGSGTELTLYPAGRGDGEYILPLGVTGVAAGAFSGCESLEALCVPFDFDEALLRGSGIGAAVRRIPYAAVTVGAGGAAAVSGSRVSAPAGSLLIAVSRDGAGRPLDIRVCSLTAPRYGEVCPFPGFDAGSCRLLLLDAQTWAPLCEAYGG